MDNEELSARPNDTSALWGADPNHGDAETMLRALSREYPTHARLRLQRCFDCMGPCRGGPLPDHARTAILEIAHDLKGEGGSFGYPLVTRIAHSLSCLLRQGAEASDGRLAAIVRGHIEAIDIVLEKRITGSGDPLTGRLVVRLEALVSDLLANPSH